MLETPKISEALPYAKIISEMPCNEDIDIYKIYKDVVEFVPAINSAEDITTLAEKITQILDYGDKDRMRHRLSVIKQIKTINNNVDGSDIIKHMQGRIDTRNRKFSIIMAYYNRKEQTILTLDQFERLYGGTYNIEVVIVDDNSDNKERLNDIINNYSFTIKYIVLTNKNWINPVVPMNVAITNISPDVDVVIVQNPETFHCGDILGHTRGIGDSYLVYPVFNSPSYEENSRLRDLFDKRCDKYYQEFINKINYKAYGK